MATKKQRKSDQAAMPGRDVDRDRDANRDPLSGASGAHPVGTGIGAAGAGAAGAAIGALAGGPIGGAIGAVIGAVAGGYAGKGVAEMVDPTQEDNYCREHYQDRPYVRDEQSYEDYQPAYRYGWEACCGCAESGTTYDQADEELGKQWDKNRGASKLSWTDARPAVRDAWDRVRGQITGRNKR